MCVHPPPLPIFKAMASPLATQFTTHNIGTTGRLLDTYKGGAHRCKRSQAVASALDALFWPKTPF